MSETETRWESQRRERDALADRLADEYASGLPSHVADTVFRLAWEHGHANGESDVESYYVDFADLATTAYHAAPTQPSAEIRRAGTRDRGDLRMSTLSERIKSEAAQDARPGQHDRLMGIADEVAALADERDRLKRGGAELGKSLMFWMNLAVEVTGSQDCIDEDGDGDWGAVAERLAEMSKEQAR